MVILFIYYNFIRYLNTIIICQCVAARSKAPAWKTRGCWFSVGRYIFILNFSITPHSLQLGKADRNFKIKHDIHPG